MIVMALAAGAAAGLKETASSAVKDAYAGVRRLIGERYGGVDLEPLEQKPASEAKQASVAEDLEEAGAGSDQELLDQVRKLVAAVEEHDPGAAAAVGVDLEKVKAASLHIEGVAAEGTGVRVRESEFAGDVDIRDVRAGPGGGARPNPP
jgi:uncharacterized protein YbjQ (UPF0145 family)